MNCEYKFEDLQGAQREISIQAEKFDQGELIVNSKVLVHWKLRELGKWKDMQALLVYFLAFLLRLDYSYFLHCMFLHQGLTFHK